MEHQKKSFSEFAIQCIKQAEKQGHFSTAHLYYSALCSFRRYLRTRDIQFRDLSRESLILYNNYLINNGKMPNTISTYMRMLRSIYNQAVDRDIAPYIRRQFHDVFTGVEVNHKRAVSPKDLHTLLYDKIQDPQMKNTQLIAKLLFGLCGIAFVDLSHLKYSDIKDNVLLYHRMKTGVKVSVGLLEPIKELLKKKRTSNMEPINNDNYILDILDRNKAKKSKDGYKEYQVALRRINNRLKKLAMTLKLNKPITTYTLRHSWATTAQNLGVSVEKISEMLGHKSIKTTQTYLKGFNIDDLTKENVRTCKYVESLTNNYLFTHA